MMRTSLKLRRGAAFAALLLAGTATGAQAQFSGDPGAGGADTPAAGNASAPDAGADRQGKRGERQQKKRQVAVTPYLEVGQVLTADLKNGGDVLTYTTVAAGVVAGRS